METIHARAPDTLRGHGIREISDKLGVSEGLILKEIKAGRLPAKRVGRRLIVMADDLTAFLENATEQIGGQRP
jgi:excisionase family DNA binding protein